MINDTLDEALVARYAPRPQRRPLVPPLTLAQELALTCRMLFQEGYNDHIAGHISVRLEGGDLLANPWELTWGEVCASDIVTLDATGKVKSGGWNITPAIGLHLMTYARRPDVRVVIHNHPRWASIWAATGRVPPVYDQSSALVDGAPVCHHEYDGTVDAGEAARETVEALGSDKWALLANHGVLVVANGLRQAHLRAVTLEWRARTAWHVEVLGSGTPLRAEVADAVGLRTDAHGFPFLWEAMARAEIRRDPEVLE